MAKTAAAHWRGLCRCVFAFSGLYLGITGNKTYDALSS
jgi:hypothetical protein